MEKKNPNDKSLLVRFPKDTWMFLKKTSVENETSMNRIINDCINKYKKDIKNILTNV